MKIVSEHQRTNVSFTQYWTGLEFTLLEQRHSVPLIRTMFSLTAARGHLQCIGVAL